MAFAKIKPVPLENAQNAVIYARYSSDKQTENSIDAQLRAAYTYCEQKGLSVIGEYIDRAISGTTDNRPDFQRMIADAKKQQFAYIVVYRFDRFARNRYDSAIYKKELENYGVRVLSTEESVGVGDEGIILESIYEAMAESYSRRLSKVVTRGMRETAMKGLSTGGNLSFGYKIKDHHLVIDEGEAIAVRTIFESYAEGRSKTEIAKRMTESGFRSKTGKPFSVCSISRILENRMYIGENDYLDIKRACPAIVEKELFEIVQRELISNKRTYGKKQSEINYLLSGKVYCGYCGKLLIGDSGTSASGTTYPYYSCSKRKKNRDCKKKSEKKDAIEKYICEQTLCFVLSDKSLDKIAKQVALYSEKEANSDRSSVLEKQIDEIEKNLDEATDALIKTNSPTAIRRINDRIELLEAKQQSLSRELSEIRIREEQRLTEKEVRTYLETFRYGKIENENFQKRIINALVNCVYVFDDKIVIYYNIKESQSISYQEMLSDLDDVSKSSTNSPHGSPPFKLSEQIRFVYKSGVFGAVISRE